MSSAIRQCGEDDVGGLKRQREMGGATDRLAATLSLGLLAVLRDIDDVAAAAGRHGRSLLPLRGGTGRVVALVAVVRVRPRVLGRRLVVDGHDVGHALGDGAGAR
jgi:hypothetical protein